MPIKKLLFLFTPVFFVLVSVSVFLDNKNSISLSQNCENNFYGILSRLKISHENYVYESRKIDFLRSYPVMIFSKADFTASGKASGESGLGKTSSAGNLQTNSGKIFEIEFRNLKTPTRATFTDGREISFVLEYDESENCHPKSGVLIRKTFNGDIISRLGRYDCFNKSKIVSNEDALLCAIMNENPAGNGAGIRNKNTAMDAR